VFGLISLILAFFVLGTLPVNWAGVALILLAFVLFAAEFLVAGFGALGIGGVVSLIAGGLLLTTSDSPDFEVSRWLVIGTGIFVGAFLMLLIAAVIKTRRTPAKHGTLAMVGNKAIVRTDLDPAGYVFVEGERWKAVAADQDMPIKRGEAVTITSVSGFTLHVRRKEALDMEQRLAAANKPLDPPEPPKVPSGERMPPAIIE
jgi:membrane-bound serine protease (ClpP class)